MRCSGYSAVPEPSRPFSLSKIETRTLRVPKSTPATIVANRCSSVMPIEIPTQVTRARLVQDRTDRGQVGGYVVLEPLLANVAQQMLHSRNFNDACAAEGFERIVRELPIPHIAAYFPGVIVGGKAGVAHGAGFHAAYAGAEGIFFPHGASDDRLKIHVHVGEEMLGQVAAVETDGLIRIATVVVIPIEQRTRRARGQP